MIDKDSDCDNNAVADGYVSLTPLTRDYTAYKLIDSLNAGFASIISGE